MTNKNLFEKTKAFFALRNTKPAIKIERKPKLVYIALSTSVSDKVEIPLDDWVAYARVVSSYRIYGCFGATIQNYTAIVTTPPKETGIEASTFTNMPSKIIRVAGSRSFSFVAATNGAVWTTLELWGEDDL